MEDEWIARYRMLSELRHQIAQFVHFGSEAARAAGVEPQQLQLILAVKGLPGGARPTISTLALRLCLKQHSVVEMANRLAELGLLVRRRGPQDRRQVWLELTPLGEEVLARCKDSHTQELGAKAIELCKALQGIMDGATLR